MNNVFLITAIFLMGVSPKVFAGGCLMTEVSNEKSSIAMGMATDIREQVIEIDEKTGGDNEVFIVARLGHSMDGFNLLAENLIGDKALSKIFFDAGVQTYRSGEKNPRRDLVRDEKLKYSHMGFYVKKSRYKANEEAGVEPKDWTYVIHLLAQCDLCNERYGKSDIQYEMFDRFFWDAKIIEDEDDLKNQVLVLVPSKEIQRNLRELLHRESKKIAKDGLHEPNYNVISPAQQLKPIKIKGKKIVMAGRSVEESRSGPTQNSNQWPLEMLAASLFPKGIVKDRFEAQQVLNHKDDPKVDCESKHSSSNEIQNCKLREDANTAYIPSMVTPTGTKTWNACGHADGLFNLGLFWDATNIMDCQAQDFRYKKIFQLITADSVAKWLDKNHFLQGAVEGFPSKPGFEGAAIELTADINKIRSFQEAGKTIDKIVDDRKERRIKYLAKKLAKKKRIGFSEAKRIIEKEMEKDQLPDGGSCKE